MQDIESALFSSHPPQRAATRSGLRTDLKIALKKARNHIGLPGEDKNPLSEWCDVRRIALTLLEQEEKNFLSLCVLFEAECVLDRLSSQDMFAEDASVFSKGFDILTRFTEEMWEQIEPKVNANDDGGQHAGSDGEDKNEEDEEYLIVRADALSALNRALPPILLQAPLWRQDEIAISSYELDMADGVKRLRQQRPDVYAAVLQGDKLSDTEKLSPEDSALLQKLCAQTSKAVISACQRTANDVTAFRQLQATLRRYFGHHAPGYGAIEAALDARKRAASGFAAAKNVATPSDATDENDMSAEDTHNDTQSPDNAAPAQRSAIRNRTDAYAALREIAAFLRTAEPHSPVPFMIEKAVRWGGMSFEALLAEWVRDGGQQDEIRHYLGIDDSAADSDTAA